jgi:hypothetical protein
MGMVRLNRSKLVTTSRRVVMTVLLAALGLIIGIPSMADALDLRRRFYLTEDGFQVNEALTACDKGFHMASLWEIFDTSNLKYDTQRGLTKDDSGSGPPFSTGWIRTGNESSNSASAGVGNCLNWISNAAGDNGTAVNLNGDWGSTTGRLTDPWLATRAACNNVLHVWCVQH